MNSKRALYFPLSVGVLLSLWMIAVAPIARAAESVSRAPHAVLVDNVDRPLRYAPVGADFVITNGAEFFNRPLYGGHNGFRVDAGDQPEFSLYLPGHGGNLRFGIKAANGTKWLNDADKIVARYGKGTMRYEIGDALLEDGCLNIVVVPQSQAKGFVVEIAAEKTPPLQLVWAFGGANGARGARNGDIGCEREPVSKYFQLRPDECQADRFELATNGFILHAKAATILGLVPAMTSGSKLFVADAHQWPSLESLLASENSPSDCRVAAGQLSLGNHQKIYLAFQAVAENSAAPMPEASHLANLFEASLQEKYAVANQVSVSTPDPFINAAVPALNIAADAIWDDTQQAFMHGAVAWRMRLLGWRGPYAGDELGWHERTAAHFAGYAKQQNTNEISARIPPPEESANLSRNETALHSNGDLTKSHYDMNLLAVDAFFRHLLWTGDLDYARKMWPVIERHLAWERRLFRREFGPEKLPLYEGYAAIWASDDLAYNGGVSAHASALNFYANKMAARVAQRIGENPAPYEREAELILQAMQKYLWLPEAGTFAEFKDYLGLQLAHPNTALWTFYHTIDSEAATPAEAWQMSRWVDENIAHIPVAKSEIRNSKSEIPFTLPETSWMPYQWSLNNVVVAEAAHASLAFWQANRPDTAFALFKGDLLDTMYLGLCPGNVGAMTAHDMARGEAQRDFGDGIGAVSRALVEGLFGVKPDALAGELKIVPGFPADWTFAKMRHPDFNFEFRRESGSDNFLVEPKFARPMKLILQIPARGDQFDAVLVNGRPAQAQWVEEIFGQPRVAILCEAAPKWEVQVVWKGPEPAERMPAKISQPAQAQAVAFDWEQNLSAEKFESVNLAPVFNDRVTQIFRNVYRSPRSPFCSLAAPKQGVGSWCHPNDNFVVDDAGLRALAAQSGGKIILPNRVPLATPGAADAKNIAFVSQWENYPREISVPLAGKASQVFLLMAGSTGAMQSRFDNGEVVVTYADGSTARLALRNPTTWWPIEQDYFVDDFAFRRPEPLPVRVDLQTGKIRVLKMDQFKGRGGAVPGGAATVLPLPLEPGKELKSLTVRALANEVVIGLMSVTLQR